MAVDEAKDDARLFNSIIAQGRYSPLCLGLLLPFVLRDATPLFSGLLTRPSRTATTLRLDHYELGLGRYELEFGRYELEFGRSGLESGRCTHKSGTSPRGLLLRLTFGRGATSPPHHPFSRF